MPFTVRNTAEKSFVMRVLIGALVGGAIGFGIGYLGKCTSGACPLTSNPIISTLIGAMLGALATMAK